MRTYHKLIIGDSSHMEELKDESMHLIVTSPPYFNAPFDYSGFYSDYDEYLEIMKLVCSEMFRVLQTGRILAINIDDMLVDGIKYPITADITKLLQNTGFTYRDRIIWKKPDGYLRISRRSGVLLKFPYPMYYYPDNLLESILIFQKGKYDYRSADKSIKQSSQIDLELFKKNKWYSTLWEICNVLPGSVLERGVAAFPEEIPFRLINLFSHKTENVLDPFVGSGTTMKVAKDLGRNSVGVELNSSLKKTICLKCGFPELANFKDEALYFNLVDRKEAKSAEYKSDN